MHVRFAHTLSGRFGFKAGEWSRGLQLSACSSGYIDDLCNFKVAEHGHLVVSWFSEERFADR